MQTGETNLRFTVESYDALKTRYEAILPRIEKGKKYIPFIFKEFVYMFSPYEPGIRFPTNILHKYLDKYIDYTENGKLWLENFIQERIKLFKAVKETMYHKETDMGEYGKYREVIIFKNLMVTFIYGFSEVEVFKDMLFEENFMDKIDLEEIKISKTLQ